MMRILEPELYFADDFRDSMRAGYQRELEMPTDLLTPDEEIIEGLNDRIHEIHGTVAGYFCGILKARHERRERGLPLR